MVIAAVVGLITSAAACAVAIGVLRHLGALDVPNARSSHGRATIRGAGVGVACGTVTGVVAAVALYGGTGWPMRATSILVAASLSAGVIGLVDDLRDGTSFRVRLAVQVIVVSSAVLALGAGDTDLPWSALLLAGAVVGVVGYVNAFNFMDGINGISGGAAFVAGVMFAVVGRLEGLLLLEAGGAALAAACLGFLPFNVPTARAFLGDVGSYFIGAWIALLAFVAILAGVPLDVVLAPLALYLADVGFTLASRVRRGEAWHTAHRDHAYQRLAASGLGHMGTTALVLSFILGLSGLGLLSLRMPAWRAAAWPAMVGLLAAYLAAPALVRRHQGRTQPAGSPSAAHHDRVSEGPGSR